MPSNGKCRNLKFQNEISDFTNLLHQIVHFQKRGNPQAKKRLRFDVCPDCQMKSIVSKLNHKISPEYVFPCICTNQRITTADIKRQMCDPKRIEDMLSGLKSKHAVNFEMICIVTTNEKQYYKKIMWKPLRKNTWNRNNQPTCDNIRITAVSSAFATIASTPWGNIELHVTGPEIINKKPYSRLGVGINMLSKDNWKPGFLFMTSEDDKLQNWLKIELRYPLSFQGKINVGWPKQGYAKDYHPVFEIDTHDMYSRNDNRILEAREIRQNDNEYVFNFYNYGNNNNDNNDVDVSMHQEAKDYSNIQTNYSNNFFNNGDPSDHYNDNDNDEPNNSAMQLYNNNNNNNNNNTNVLNNDFNPPVLPPLPFFSPFPMDVDAPDFVNSPSVFHDYANNDQHINDSDHYHNHDYNPDHSPDYNDNDNYNVSSFPVDYGSNQSNDLFMDSPYSDEYNDNTYSE